MSEIRPRECHDVPKHASLQSSKIGDAISRLVLDQYRQLPSRGKPLVRSNGAHEWAILAGVVLELPSVEMACVALATGVKALPDKIVHAAHGLVVHDMHAEILALRALNRFLMEQAAELLNGSSGEDLTESKWLELREGRVRARAGLRIHLYVSSPPCGDASMSLLQGEVWQKSVPPEDTLIRGRNHYNAHGYIRTKPGRADSELTMSKSCSDKLALRQFTGLLLGPASQVLDSSDFFLDTLVCPLTFEGDFKRAFSRWSDLGAARHFRWVQTCLEFPDGREAVEKRSLRSANQAERSPAVPPSPLSLVWFPGGTEILSNGVRQGNKALSGRGSSLLCRHSLCELALSLVPRPNATLSYVEWKSRHKPRPRGWQGTAVDDFPITGL